MINRNRIKRRKQERDIETDKRETACIEILETLSNCSNDKSLSEQEGKRIVQTKWLECEARINGIIRYINIELNTIGKMEIGAKGYQLRRETIFEGAE